MAVPAPIETSAPWTVLADTARALHAERDPLRALNWAATASRAIALADVAGVATADTVGGRLLWRWAGRPASTRDDPVLRLVAMRVMSGDLPAIVYETSAQAAVSDEHGSIAPDAAAAAALMAVTALVVRPIPSASGGRRGVVLTGGSSVPDDDRIELLDALCAHIGVALDNHDDLARLAELEAAQREVVHQLQEAVRPPQPQVPDTELGVHYLPADLQAPTGGDLYDWVVLPDGDLHVAVVDIMGKGVAATKDAVAVTHALRLLALDGCPLSDLVQRTDQLVAAQNPDLVATLVVARYRPSTGRLRLVGAGHPPALLVSAGGQCVELPAPGIPIGWPGAGSHKVIEREMARSDTLVLYTDGLVEANKDILAGLTDLRRYAEEISEYPARHLARSLVERALAGAMRRDDSLALVLRRRVPPSLGGPPPLGPFEYRFSPNTAAVSLARHLLSDWLVRAPVEPAALDDLVLVASELCSNAVRHARGDVASVALRARVEGASIVLEAEDDGAGGLQMPGPDDGELPDPDAEEGRGLFLVQALTDELEFETEAERTVVRCVKRAVVADLTRGVET